MKNRPAFCGCVHQNAGLLALWRVQLRHFIFDRVPKAAGGLNPREKSPRCSSDLNALHIAIRPDEHFVRRADQVEVHVPDL